MKVWFNQEVYDPQNPEEVLWEAKNGATRITLKLINKLNHSSWIAPNLAICRVGYLDKGNHSFIFLNEDGRKDETIRGIFLCNGYGYTVISGEELFWNSSVGGYGNSESKFGIYSLNTIIALHTYRNRNGNHYYQLKENGWIYLGQDIPLSESEITYI